MAGKLTERSIKWQLCYDVSARTWWMHVRGAEMRGPGYRVPGPPQLANERPECKHHYKTLLRQAAEKQLDGRPREIEASSTNPLLGGKSCGGISCRVLTSAPPDFLQTLYQGARQKRSGGSQSDMCVLT
ncbi:unnamed protein product [Pleuronectes platessa]|uniref:Uncharacterized protein n=1 Tax=Pleuronectes platessa TaxID=8262 RepID=A0A9N7VME5_PLEPL|nr:unnamed protein product [Pleuronectes platessa]